MKNTMRTMSTKSLKAVNKILKEDNLKCCAETMQILPLTDKYWGTRFITGKYVYQAYCKFAR